METLQFDSRHPTGTVRVTLDQAGHPSYWIYERVAWGFIGMMPELKKLAGGLDTVGAGASLTAALCMGIMKRHSLAQISERANRVATFVCTLSGATPLLPKDLLHG